MKIYNITISSKEKLTFISNLYTMLNAGISILQSINSLARVKKGNMKKVLDVIAEDLLQGKHLSFSFAKFPRIFDEVTINMLRASEEAGTLDITLKEMKEQIKKDMEFATKVRSALMYPVLVFVIFISVILMILLVVIPRISIVFTQLKAKLPLPTRIMIGASHFLIYDTWAVILALFILIGGALLLYRLKKNLVLSFLYSLPIISQLVLEIDLMRFCRCMNLLLMSGITITHALELCERVVIKKEIAKAIAFAKTTVMSGKPVSTALKERQHIFPDIMITLIEVGEKTGSFDKSMQESSEYFEGKVTDTLKTIIALLEPITLVVVGLMVGGMMVAIIGPIYSLIGNISPR